MVNRGHSYVDKYKLFSDTYDLSINSHENLILCFQFKHESNDKIDPKLPL